jgi:WXG100 family type VII secretion target
VSFFGEIEGIFDPGGNPEAIHASASACRAHAAELNEIIGSLDGTAATLAASWKGIPGPNGEDESAAAKYQTAWGGFRAAIQEYAEHLDAAAKQLDATADDLQHAEEEARRLWEMMIAALAVGAAMAVFTFGGSEAAAGAEAAADTAEAGVVAAETAESLSAAQVFFSQLGTTLANLAGRFMLGAGTSFVTDFIEKALKGENPFDPANWSANDITGIILSGTVGMVLGPFTMRNLTVNPLIGKMSPELADFITGSAQNINTILRESPMLGNAGYFAATSLASSSIDEFWVDGKSLDDPGAWEAVGVSTGLGAAGGAAFGGAIQGFRWLNGTPDDGGVTPGGGTGGTAELASVPDTPNIPAPQPPDGAAPEPQAGGGDGGGTGGPEAVTVPSGSLHDPALPQDTGDGSAAAALAGSGGPHAEVTSDSAPGPAPAAPSADGSGSGPGVRLGGGGDGQGPPASGPAAGHPDVVSDGSAPAGNDGPPVTVRGGAEPSAAPAGTAAEVPGSARVAAPGDGSTGGPAGADGSPVTPGAGDGAGMPVPADGSAPALATPAGVDGAGVDGAGSGGPGADGSGAGGAGTGGAGAGTDGAGAGADGADPATGAPMSAIAGRISKVLNDVQDSPVARYVRLGPTDVGRAVTKVPFNVADSYIIKTPPSPPPAVPPVPVPVPPPAVPVPQVPPPPPPPSRQHPGQPAPSPGTPSPGSPPPGTPSPGTPGSHPVPPSPGHRVGGGDIRVQPGDTLWEIAKERLGNPLLWPLIEKANPQVGPNGLIFPGQVLTIPQIPAPPTGSTVVVVEPGDTLWGIADGNETLVQEIAEINQLTDPSLIFVGQTLVVPPAG